MIIRFFFKKLLRWKQANPVFFSLKQSLPVHAVGLSSSCNPHVSEGGPGRFFSRIRSAVVKRKPGFGNQPRVGARSSSWFSWLQIPAVRGSLLKPLYKTKFLSG